MKVAAHVELTIDIEFDVDLNSNMPVKDQASDVVTDYINTMECVIGGMNVTNIVEIK